MPVTIAPWLKVRPYLNTMMSPGPGLGDLAKAIGGEAEISLLAAMQMPVFRVGPRIERREKPRIDEDADQKHPAVDAGAAHVGAGVIGRPDPSPRLGDDAARVRLLQTP